MTNLDRATDLMAKTLWDDNGNPRGTVTEAAEALASTGLLMADLPKPDHNGRWWTKRGQSHRYVRTGSIYSDNDRVVVSDGEGSRHTSMYLTTEEAIDLAYALLAAAEYAERNQE